ncbi:uncharacterized protein LOC130907933 [Corythoichthys intestinalis]|uniref:uncharacterized protein LOC130907933 n=1 Tax=Corythoichthys intestinalis TaxID=161448 RepID=UPI0025A511A0|nr:uncharacterized protein LOC130907933 [Corythoichthys intestinalis]
MSTSYMLRSASHHLAMMSTCSVSGVLEDHAHYQRSYERKYPFIKCSTCTGCKPFQRSQAPLKRKRSSETRPEAVVPSFSSTTRPHDLPKETVESIPLIVIPPVGQETEAEAPIPYSAIPHCDLPVASVFPRIPQPPICSPEPLIIHNLSVEEHQYIYHEIVDEKLRFMKGRTRTYRLAEGRLIKEKLWERLCHPMFTTTEDANGRVQITPSYGTTALPPQYEVDISQEPKPPKLSRTQ